MIRVKEALAIIKQARGKQGDLEKNIFFPKLPTPLGSCAENLALANKHGGKSFRSHEAKVIPEQVYPGHAVWVLENGVVLDYSNPRRTLVGQIDPQGDVAKQLVNLTGYPGWHEGF